MENYTIDETDLRILRELQSNSRLTNKELAARIHLSTTPTFERHRRLERLGYICQYTAVVDAGRINRGFMVLCMVRLGQINQRLADEFKAAVEEWQEVTECYNVSGDCDFMMKVCVGGMRQYQEFILNKVGALTCVSRIESVFVMDVVKQRYGVGI